MTQVILIRETVEIRMPQSQSWNWIPTHLTIEQFEQFVLPHLYVGSRGPQPKISLHTIFNYILKLLYLGCQWKELPIAKDEDGQPEIHYSRIYRAFRRFEREGRRGFPAMTNRVVETQGCFDNIFAGSVSVLHQKKYLDTSVIHADGTTTAAKKGGDNLGFSGHKQMKGDKVVAFCDRNCNVIAPFVKAPGNRNESPLLRKVLPQVTCIARMVGFNLKNTIISLDGVYDSRANRKAIFNRGMIPNINENRRGRTTPKAGPKKLFVPAIFQERFRTIERVFAWEDKFKRLLLRFERISQLHYALKCLAYTMINLRHFCQD